jgi:hypothetical protein
MNVRTFRLFVWVSVMFSVFVMPARAEEVSDRAMQDEIRALKQMVLELQKRIQRLEKNRVKPEGAETAATMAPATSKPAKGATAKAPEPKKIVPTLSLPAKAQKSAKPAPIPGDGKPEKMGIKPPAPLELGGHEVRVGISGAIQADVIHDFNALGLKPSDGQAREFITAYIPVGGPAATITNRTAFSPNQSYLTGWAETDTPWGPLKVYADVNLFGSMTGTEFEIYKAYGEWGWLKAGLDYTLWLNQASIPDTLDFEGPNIIPEVRFTQASLKIPLQLNAKKRELFFTIGVEDAPGEITLPAKMSSDTTVTTDQFPAVIGKLSYEPDWAQIELGGLYRRLRVEGPRYDQSVNGWGVILSGSIDTWKNDSIILGGLYGNALGAYIQDTAGMGLDAAPTSSANPSLKAIPAFGVWAAYQHWWSKSLRSSATYGLVRLDSDFDLWPKSAGTGTYKQTQYASMNLVWSPWPPFDVGLEYMFGRRTVTDSTAVDGSTTGQNHRVQFTMRWNFDWER